jgi:hypothetical protein
MQFSVRVKIDYNNDFTVKVKYLFFTLYPKKSKKAKKKHRKRIGKKVARKKKRLSEKLEKKMQDKQSLTARIAKDSGLDKVAEDIKKGNSRSFDFEMFKLIYDSAKPPLRKLIGKTRVEKLCLNCVIGGDDAAKVALTYGFQSAAISGGLAWLNEVLILKVKKVSVTADFSKEKTDLRLQCRVRIKVATLAGCLLQYAINTAKNSK